MYIICIVIMYFNVLWSNGADDGIYRRPWERWSKRSVGKKERSKSDVSIFF